MNHDVFDTLVAVYAVGALDGEELAAFEAHLAEGCPRCAAAVREGAETLAILARETPPAIPPAPVREALLRRTSADAAARRAARRPVWPRWAIGTAAAVVIVSALTAAFVAARYEARLGQMARETTALRERLQRDEAALQDQIALARDVIGLLRDPSTRVVALHGVGPRPEASGRVIWNARAGGQVLVANLSSPPPGKTYELWAIAAGRPRAAGVFGVDASGGATRRIAPGPGAPSVEMFAITLEPEGGVPAPTGPMVLASK